LEGLPFWLPVIVISVEEVPSLMFVIYLAVIKES